MKYERHICRFCSSKELTPFLDLGLSPLADGFISNSEDSRGRTTEIYVPLSVQLCQECGLSQLSCVVPPEILYDESYLYDASVTDTGRAHWQTLARNVWNRFNCREQDLVLDIGSNSGALLTHFKELGAKELGIDPARTPTALAKERGIETLVDLFNEKTARVVAREYGLAKIITATNVFAHVDDVSDFMRGVDALLAPGGVLIIEAPHFLELVRRLEYDTIYHEHLSYLAAKPLSHFLGRQGFSLFDIEKHEIHGGTLRYYIARQDEVPVCPIVADTIKEEEEFGLFNLPRLKAFSEDVKQNRSTIIDLLHSLKSDGFSIAAVGAPAKGMTLLNFCTLDTRVIDFITEKSALKIGALSPGMRIPILPDSQLLEKRPDYCLLLAWNFADEIMRNLSEYRANGGKFIIPIPTPTIV